MYKSKIKPLLFFILIVSLMIISCGEKEEKVEQKSTDQMLQEKGYPVKVQKITGQTIAREFNYTAILQGIQQSRATSSLSDELADVHVQVGDRVEKNDVIAEFDEDSPTAGYLQAKSAYDIAEKTFNRLKKLYEVGGISKQKLDEAETQYDVAKANLESAKKAIKIFSPINGIVTEVNFFAGDNVHPGDPVAVIADFSTMKTTIQVTENDIQYFHVGLPVDITWDSYPNKTFKGKVNKVSLSANPDTRSFEVEINIPNPNNVLKPGTVVTVHVQANEVRDTIVIPKLIVREIDNKQYVFVVEDNKAKQKFIEVGIDTGTELQVISGLEFGQHVVIEGHQSLSDGAKVNIVNSEQM